MNSPNFPAPKDKPPHDVSSTFRSGWAEIAAAIYARNGPYYLIANDGNAGDALISAATFQFLSLHKIEVSVLRFTDPPPNSGVLILPGGGYMNPRYRHWEPLVFEAQQKNDLNFIILPSSMHGVDAVLANANHRYAIFCRDQASLDYCLSVAGNEGTCRLAHDMALGLEIHPNEVSRTNGLSSEQAALIERFKECALKLTPDAFGRLVLMRADSESCFENTNPSADLSGLLISTFDSPAFAEAVAAVFLDCIGRARRIVTDRLHVVIGATLLGKSTLAMDNLYGKINGVYTLSLSACEHVEFIGLGQTRGTTGTANMLPIDVLENNLKYLRDLEGYRKWAEKKIDWMETNTATLMATTNAQTHALADLENTVNHQSHTIADLQSRLDRLRKSWFVKRFHPDV